MFLVAHKAFGTEGLSVHPEKDLPMVPKVGVKTQNWGLRHNIEGRIVIYN